MDYQDAGRVPARGPQPGLQMLRAHVKARWAVRDLGIYNVRTKRGGSTLSLHAEGRAWDCGLDARDWAERARGDDIAAWLVANHEALQVQAVFWHRRRWRCDRGWRATPTDALHDNHLHIERTWAGARDTRPIADILAHTRTPTLEELTTMTTFVAHVDVPESNAGIWTLLADGTVHCHGDAPTLGSTPPLSAPAVALVAAGPAGYWILAADGGVFAFGAARFAGSYPGLPPAARQGTRTFYALRPYRDGRGYSLLASDGAVYQFGTAA